MNKYDLKEIERQLELARQPEKRPRSNLVSELIKSAVQIAIFPALVYMIFSFVLGIANVQQTSMLPNFVEGDYIIFNRIVSNYKLGDVVIINNEAGNNLLIKRVIGVPGDIIEITEDNIILINGSPIRESWQTLGATEIKDVRYPVTLQDNEYFVIGDNRENSNDSRLSIIGNIKENNIIGVVVYRFKMSR